MSIEFPKSAAAHIEPDEETIVTKDDGSFEKIKDYNELDELNDYNDEHKKRAIFMKDIKKCTDSHNEKRGKAKASKPKRTDYRLN